MTWKTCASDDEPTRWLGSSLGIDLDAKGLRELAERLAGSAQGARFQALALFQYVAALPFEMSDPLERTSPAALSRLRSGDAYFKTTLMVHLLRLRAVPARMRWVELEPRRVSRGLWDFVGHTGMPFFYPLLEVWINGGWLTTDAYIMDAPLLEVVHRELAKRQGASGYFAHRDGVATWDGESDALQRFSLSDPESWPLRDLGSCHSHADFLRIHLATVPETDVTNMAYGHQARNANDIFARMREQT